MKSLKRQVSEPILLKIPESKNENDSDNDNIIEKLNELHNERTKYYLKYKDNNTKYNRENFKLNLLNEINILNEIIKNIEYKNY